MGKRKTSKSIAKRFRKTARGRVLHARPGKSHLNTNKSRGRKRRLRRGGKVHAAFEKQIALRLA
jgi:large subunit ribosomal protein L35